MTALRFFDEHGRAIVSLGDACHLLALSRSRVLELDEELDPIVEPLGRSGTRHRRWYAIDSLEDFAKRMSERMRVALEERAALVAEIVEVSGAMPRGGRAVIDAILELDRIDDSRAARRSVVPLAVIDAPRPRRRKEMP